MHERLCDTKVRNHRQTRRQEDILRLHIAMNEPLLVRIRERATNLPRNADRFWNRKRTVLREAGPQRFTGHKWHHIIEEPIDFTGLMEW